MFVFQGKTDGKNWENETLLHKHDYINWFSWSWNKSRCTEKIAIPFGSGGLSLFGCMSLCTKLAEPEVICCL